MARYQWAGAVVEHAAQIESFRKAFSGEEQEKTPRGRGEGRASLSRKEVEEMSYQEA